MTPSQTHRRRERERVERHAAILDAARKVFFSQGIQHTTMDDVAAAAQVSKGTVYLYFQSKETILAALLQEGLSLLVRQLEQACQFDQPLSAIDRLRRITDAYLHFFQHYPHYYRLLMSFENREPKQSIASELYQDLLHSSSRGLALLVRIIEQGVADNTFSTADPRQAASVIWAMLHGLYAILGHPLRREIIAAPPGELFTTAVDLAIRGLLKSNERPS